MASKKNINDNKKTTKKRSLKRSTRKKTSVSKETHEEAVYFMGPASDEKLIDESQEAEDIQGEFFETEQVIASLPPGEKHQHRDHNINSFNAGRFFIGVTLIFVGAVFLGQNIGLFNIVRFDLTQLWPLILVFLGFSMFSFGPKGKIVGMAIFFVIAISAAGFIFSGDTFFGVEPSGNVVTEVRTIEPFTKIELKGRGIVYLEQGDFPRINVESDEKLLPYITTKVERDSLMIDFSNSFASFFLGKDVPVHFFITVPDIKSVHIFGSGKLFSKPITVESIELAINGRGEMSIPIKAGEITARINGRGVYNLTGTTTRQIIFINGSGAYHGLELVSNEAGARVNGSGEIEINVSNELDVEIAGSGTVLYLGNPFVSNSSVLGRGVIRSLESNNENQTRELEIEYDKEKIEKLRKIDEVEELQLEG